MFFVLLLATIFVYSSPILDRHPFVSAGPGPPIIAPSRFHSDSLTTTFLLSVRLYHTLPVPHYSDYTLLSSSCDCPLPIPLLRSLPGPSLTLSRRQKESQLPIDESKAVPAAYCLPIAFSTSLTSARILSLSSSISRFLPSSFSTYSPVSIFLSGASLPSLSVVQFHAPPISLSLLSENVSREGTLGVFCAMSRVYVGGAGPSGCGTRGTGGERRSSSSRASPQASAWIRRSESSFVMSWSEVQRRESVRPERGAPARDERVKAEKEVPARKPDRAVGRRWWVWGDGGVSGWRNGDCSRLR